MRASTGALAPYLAAIIGKTIPPDTIMADCFTFTLANGNQYFYTNADYPISFYNYDATDFASGRLDLGQLGTMKPAAAGEAPTATFLANSVRISGLKFSSKIGVDVDEQDVTISAAAPPYFPQSGSADASGVLNAGKLAQMELAEGPFNGPAWGPSTELVEGVPFLTALRQGIFDYATLQRDRAFLPSASPGVVPIGTTTLFYGLISSIDKIGRTEAQVKVKSLLVRLAADFPRNPYQATCWYQLYGPGCLVSKSANAHNGTVGAGSTNQIINWTNAFTAPQPAGGTIKFTSGVLNGATATIDTSSSTQSFVRGALPVAPQTGDTFTAYAGCDHTSGLDASGNVISGNIGCAYFNNVTRFPGFPRVPPPATSY